MNKTNFTIYGTGEIVKWTLPENNSKSVGKLLFNKWYRIEFFDGTEIQVNCLTEPSAYVSLEFISYGKQGVSVERMFGGGLKLKFDTENNITSINSHVSEETKQPEPITRKPAKTKAKPNHYTWHPHIECHLVAEEFTYNIGVAIAYLWRYLYKGCPIKDLEKARDHITFEIERLGKKYAERKNNKK